MPVEARQKHPRQPVVELRRKQVSAQFPRRQQRDARVVFQQRAVCLRKEVPARPRLRVPLLVQTESNIELIPGDIRAQQVARSARAGGLPILLCPVSLLVLATADPIAPAVLGLRVLLAPRSVETKVEREFVEVQRREAARRGGNGRDVRDRLRGRCGCRLAVGCRGIEARIGGRSRGLSRGILRRLRIAPRGAADSETHRQDGRDSSNAMYPRQATGTPNAGANIALAPARVQNRARRFVRRGRRLVERTGDF